MGRSSVIVLGVYHQTLAVLRSLHRAGYRVVLGRGAGRCPEQYSTCCDAAWIHPSLDSAEFGPALARYLDAHPEVGFLFPVGEETALAVVALDGLESRGVSVVGVRPDLLRACLDKPEGNALAASTGLAVPPAEVVTSLPELLRAATRIGFPLIVKPLTSKSQLLGRKAYLLADAEALGSAFSCWPQTHRELLVQAYVAGSLESCDYVAQAGRVVGYFEADVVRTDMPDGTGFGVDFRSRPVTADVLAACRQFCAATGYDGPGLLQFIRSERDGRLYFVENNPRLSAGIEQAVLCGQDIPLLTLRVAAAQRSGERLPDLDEREPYRPHVRTHWLYRDLQALFDRRGELNVAQLLARVRTLVMSFLSADNHMVWQWRDPLPSVALYARLLARLARGSLRHAS